MNTNSIQPVKPIENKPLLPNENINTNKSLLDLDKEIPNYTQNILNRVDQQNFDLQLKIEEAKQIAGAFISDKWSKLKDFMQKWSIGYTDNQIEQQGGKKRTRVKRKRKYKKTKHNRK